VSTGCALPEAVRCQRLAWLWKGDVLARAWELWRRREVRAGGKWMEVRLADSGMRERATEVERRVDGSRDVACSSASWCRLSAPRVAMFWLVGATAAGSWASLPGRDALGAVMLYGVLY
jgi:hypothetical protein